jgi:hypothetical protein
MAEGPRGDGRRWRGCRREQRRPDLDEEKVERRRQRAGDEPELKLELQEEDEER